MKDENSVLRQKFTARQAVAVTKIRSTYMLDYLHRHDIVRPTLNSTPGKGKRRHYSFSDLVILRVIGTLLAQGLPVKNLKKAFLELGQRLPRLGGDIASKLYLVTDGKNVYWHKSREEIVDLTSSGQLAFAFILDARRVHNEVMAAVYEINKSRAA
jgi:DNA-binding transcriptional MerR regulator